MHLHAAAARGDLDGIRFALARGTDPNARDSLGDTALHRALSSPAGRASRGVPRAGLAALELLLEAGADLAAEDSLGRQAVHLAASIPDPTFIDYFVRRGCSVRQVAAWNYSCAVMAAYQAAGPGKLRVLERLVAGGVDLDLVTEHHESPLSVCLRFGDFVALRYLLCAGADPSPLRWTPLHRAVAFGGVEEVCDLACSSAAVNEPLDRWGHSPWLLALRVGDVAKVESLAARGANLAQTDRNRLGPLHLAAQENSAALAWLLSCGADVHAVDDSGDTPLHAAVERDAIDAIRRLIAAGADLHRENAFQARPISLARSVLALELLAEAGADLDFVDGCGDWPLKNAAEAKDPERVAWLIARGAKVDNTSTGSTALHAAAQSDAREVMDQLLSAGANPNAQDADGWTAFFYAQSRETIQRLRRAGGDPSIPDHVGGRPAEWLRDPLLREALTGPLR